MMDEDEKLSFKWFEGDQFSPSVKDIQLPEYTEEHHGNNREGSYSLCLIILQFIIIIFLIHILSLIFQSWIALNA